MPHTLHSLATPTPAGMLTTLLRSVSDAGTSAGPGSGDLVVVAAGFTDVTTLMTRLGLHIAAAPAAVRDSHPIRAAIARWADGDLAAVHGLVLDQAGTDFQHQVWRALGKLPPGQTATYSQLAAAVGRPNAFRAVGSACGRNLIAPWVPCHRAVRTDGELGGYAWGLPVKQWLLEHEARSAPK